MAENENSRLGAEMSAAKWLCGLVVGGRESASMGRVLLWLCMALAVYFWLARAPELFPPTLRDALACLLGYNLGSKALGCWKERGD